MRLLIFWKALFYPVLIHSMEKCQHVAKCPCYKGNNRQHNLEKETRCIIENCTLNPLTLNDFHTKCIEHVVDFELANTETQGIQLKFFENFTQLQVLSIGNIKLNRNITSALEGISKTNLTSLKLVKVSSSDEIFKEIYNYLPSTLEELSLEIYNLTTFPLSRIQGLKHLHTLFLGGSILFRHFGLENITEALPLKKLSVADTSFFWTSAFRINKTLCVLPYLEAFNLSHTFVNVSTTITEDSCLENLQVLDLQHCIFEDGLYSDSLRFLPKLNHLIISEAINIYQLPLLNNSLTRLEMNSIQFNFNATPDNLNIFGNLGSLRHLEVRCLNLGGWSVDDLDSLLKPLKNLQYFDASNNNLTLMPKAFLKMHMLQTVILEKNLITQWHYDVFHSENLTELQLQNNRIEYLDTPFIPSTVKKLNLSYNPFLCTCDLVPFIIWVKERKELFQSWLDDWRRNRYVCACPANKQNKTLGEFNPKPTDCQPFNKIVITAMVLCCLMVLVVIVAQLVVWHREGNGVTSRKAKYRRLKPVS